LLRDEESAIRRLGSEVALSREEAVQYVRILKEGGLRKAEKDHSTEVLLSRGMIVLSGDNSRYVPVHPRLAIANYFRTYQVKVAHELKERRMRIDKLILELIPLYEATMEKRLAQRSRN